MCSFRLIITWCGVYVWVYINITTHLTVELGSIVILTTNKTSVASLDIFGVNNDINANTVGRPLVIVHGATGLHSPEA